MIIGGGTCHFGRMCIGCVVGICIIKGMLKLSYTKSGVGLLKIGILACHFWMGRASFPCIGQSKI